MATKKTTTPEVKPEMPQPGDVCECCGRRVPKNAKPPMSDDEKRERQREYNQRPEVKARQREYNKKRNAELQELRELQRTLEAQAQAQEPEAQS